MPEPPAPANGFLPARILVHRAVPMVSSEEGTWVAGEFEEGEPVPQTAVACCYFPPGTREAGRSGRILEQPILLFTGFNVDGEQALLHAEDRLVLTEGPGLTERDLGEYQVDGEPLPLGKPGTRPKGFQVNLKRVSGGG